MHLDNYNLMKINRNGIPLFKTAIVLIGGSPDFSNSAGGG